MNNNKFEFMKDIYGRIYVYVFQNEKRKRVGAIHILNNKPEFIQGNNVIFDFELISLIYNMMREYNNFMKIVNHEEYTIVDYRLPLNGELVINGAGVPIVYDSQSHYYFERFILVKRNLIYRFDPTDEVRSVNKDEYYLSGDIVDKWPHEFSSQSEYRVYKKVIVGEQ